MPSSPYPRLFETLSIGSLQLPNRIVMGAMHTRLETLDRPSERIAAFLARRAQGGAGLILTNGISPNWAGRMDADSEVLDASTDLAHYRSISAAVHDAGGRIALQLLHAGRYAKHDECVGPSATKARINRFEPRALTTAEVWATIDDFGKAASLAREAGYDAVEVMAGEGYLINEFLSSTINDRDDEFGGSFENRSRLSTEIIKAMRASTAPDFPIIWRISAIDLVAAGSTGEEASQLAKLAEAAGADALNVGVGWHESTVPTIAATVPRAAWAFASRRIKEAVSVPVIGAIRLNTPEVAEQFLDDGNADLVALARPFLADPDFAVKAQEGRGREINTCIACNQACLDHIFTDRAASCLVNPVAGRELDLVLQPAARALRIAVVGAGPAGLAFAVNAAERGHRVTIFERRNTIGGQLNLARQVPGKTEFNEMLRYFEVQIARLGVDVRLDTVAEVATLNSGEFDRVVIASGVRPRVPDIPGIDHPSVVSYESVLTGKVTAGDAVAIIGAGGIGFDVAEFLLGDAEESLDPKAFYDAWGVDPDQTEPGGLKEPYRREPRRQVTMLQRKSARLGATLGKTTGWILKSKLAAAQVDMIAGATYDRIDDEGLHYTQNGERHVLVADTIVLCAGQESVRSLYDQLRGAGMEAVLIGGAHVAAEIDAARAIDEATRAALAI